MIVGDRYHLFCDEAAGASVLGGISMSPVRTSEDGGLDADRIAASVKVEDPHYARSKLLSLENTVSGKVVSLERIKAGANIARDAGLSIHLDGARFFNAVVALDCDETTLAEPFDTISVCLSKGLGTPAGTVLVGPTDMMHQIRRNRKILGGGMRQSGILAAAGLYALDNHIQRLEDDHRRASELADALIKTGIGEVSSQTNMVFLMPSPNNHTNLVAHMAQSGIKIGGQSPAIRMVLHRDVDDEALASTIKAFQVFTQ